MGQQKLEIDGLGGEDDARGIELFSRDRRDRVQRVWALSVANGHGSDPASRF